MSGKPSEKISFRSPIPTRIVSNGEYDPIQQSDKQREVEVQLRKLADFVANEKGVSRRDVLLSGAAISLGLIAMNKVFGPFFNAHVKDVLDSEIQQKIIRATQNQFIFDVQTHMVKDDFYHKSLLRFAKWAKEQQVQSSLKGESIEMNLFRFPNFIKEVFVDSDTDLAILSGATFSNGNPLPNDYLFKVTEAVNSVADAKVLFGNYVVNPTIDGWLNRCKTEAPLFKPKSWKLFPVGDPLSVSGKPWSLDDEKLMYPFYELAMQLGIKTICVHKGLTPKNYESQHPQNWKAANVDDLPKVAKDWPELKFVIFHSALRPFASDNCDEELRSFRDKNYIRWTTDLIRISQEKDLKNVYAELGTSFASSCISNPEFCAAFMGSLLNGMGEDRIIWGTDSVWYGSPQWQIEAFRKFEIPDEMLAQKKWKKKFGDSNGEIRNKIFGLNAAKVFQIDPALVSKKSKFRSEWIEKAKNQLQTRSNRYYGYHR